MKKRIFLVFFLIIVNLTTGLAAGLGGAYIGSNYFVKPKVEESTRKVEIVEEDSQLIKVVENTQNAVVSIIISKDLPVFENYYYNPFGEDSPFNFKVPGRKQVGKESQQVGAGSGFIVSSNGYIITNRHVVSDETADYTVLLNNGDKVPAKVIDRDTVLDIAIIKIDKTGLNYIKMGDSSNIKVGQKVLAIGNALGEFSNTVSTGIISGLSRSITAGSAYSGDVETLNNIIQTDASINPGNSGGPLLDIEGNAIGVNVAVAQNAENIGFAIPINSVKMIVDSVEKYGKIVRPYLGVRYKQINEALKKANDLKFDYGVIINKGQNKDELAVIPGSPADKAGIVENDIILEVNGVKLDKSTSLVNELQKYKIGDEINLKVWSKDVEKNVKVKLEANKKL